MPFKNLFRSSGKAKDGLAQSAREAIVDVLHYCMFADKHISVREDEFIETAARTLDWDPKISYEYYEGQSTGIVRRALADKEARDAFFQSLKQRLPNRSERELALRLADDLTKSDGTKAHSEILTLAELKAVLKN